MSVGVTRFQRLLFRMTAATVVALSAGCGGDSGGAPSGIGGGLQNNQLQVAAFGIQLGSTSAKQLVDEVDLTNPVVPIDPSFLTNETPPDPTTGAISFTDPTISQTVQIIGFLDVVYPPQNSVAALVTIDAGQVDGNNANFTVPLAETNSSGQPIDKNGNPTTISSDFVPVPTIPGTTAYVTLVKFDQNGQRFTGNGVQFAPVAKDNAGRYYLTDPQLAATNPAPQAPPGQAEGGVFKFVNNPVTNLPEVGYYAPIQSLPLRIGQWPVLVAFVDTLTFQHTKPPEQVAQTDITAEFSFTGIVHPPSTGLPVFLTGAFSIFNQSVGGVIRGASKTKGQSR